MTRSLREYRWRLAAALFFVAALNYGDRTSISAVFPLLRQELGLSDIALGGLGTAFLWTYALGSPLAGMAADRWPRGRVLLSSLLAWSAVMLVTGFASQYWQLVGTRILLGVAECFYLPAATALLADYHGTATRATAMGIHSAGLSLGLIGGGVAAGYLGDHFGWRPGFFVLGAAGLALGGLAARLFLHPEAKPDSGPPAAPRPLSAVPRDLRLLAGIPSYWIILGKAMFSAIGIWIFLNWLPLYFRETFGMSLAGAGFAGTFSLQGAAIAGILLGGVVSDRLAVRDRRYRMLFQSLCYFAAAPCVLPFLFTPGAWLISAAVFCFSLFRSLGQSNENPLLCDVVPAPLRSTAIGFSNLLNSLAGGLGVLLAGVFKSQLSLGGIFAAGGGFIVLSGLLPLIGYLFFLARDLERRDRIPV